MSEPEERLISATEHFGRRLRRLRGERPQREIAAALKIPVTTYSGLEQQSTVPRGPILQRLAEFFGVASQYFYPPALSRSSESAKEWLLSLSTHSFNTKPTVATNADVVFDEETRAMFAKKLKEKLAEPESNS